MWQSLLDVKRSHRHCCRFRVSQNNKIFELIAALFKLVVLYYNKSTQKKLEIFDEIFSPPQTVKDFNCFIISKIDNIDL